MGDGHGLAVVPFNEPNVLSGETMDIAVLTCQRLRATAEDGGPRVPIAARAVEIRPTTAAPTARSARRRAAQLTR